MSQESIKNAKQVFEMLKRDPQLRTELRNFFRTDRQFIQFFGLDYQLGHGNVLYRLKEPKHE